MDMIGNLTSLIEKLQRLDFNEAENNTLTNRGGWVLTFSLDTVSSIRKGFPIQIQIRLSRDTEHILTWGCMDNDENEKFLTFFNNTQSKITQLEYVTKSIKQKKDRTVFKNL